MTVANAVEDGEGVTQVDEDDGPSIAEGEGDGRWNVNINNQNRRNRANVNDLEAMTVSAEKLQRTGVAIIGVQPYVTNYNVRLCMEAEPEADHERDVDDEAQRRAAADDVHTHPI